MNQTKNPKWHQSKKQICFLLFLLIFVTSLKGQNKTALPTNSVIKAKLIPDDSSHFYGIKNANSKC